MKFDSKSAEQISAYASGKFSPPKSTIDAEIYAVMNSLNSFKIYYLDKEELLIRTDCQAIISFFNKSSQNKPSRVRWIAFTDFITGLGIPVQFQHIEGKDNTLSDALSRLVSVITGPWSPTNEDELILAHMEDSAQQLKIRPNLRAARCLKDLMNFWANTKKSQDAAQEHVHQVKRMHEDIWRTSNGLQQKGLSIACGSVQNFGRLAEEVDTGRIITTKGGDVVLHMSYINTQATNSYKDAVRALPGRSYNTRDVIGQNWVVRPSSANIPVQPTEVNTWNLLNGNISLQFENYQATTTSRPTYNSNDEEVQSDEEEIRNHVVAVLIENQAREEELLIKRISSFLPQRRTTGAAGYDLAISYPQEIAARTRSMMATGICIQVPKGTYARIAPRSSAALRGLMIMRGVIDSDYRGELKIIVYNTTDSDIFLDQQESTFSSIFLIRSSRDSNFSKIQTKSWICVFACLMMAVLLLVAPLYSAGLQNPRAGASNPSVALTASL
ncbi:hypothetical protein ZIOFF_034314 [Zingiber officinale]|uniref:dUTP diphosphatase n=1 Tax=Zingiber officinale TaxID=94328 RepID=A0A8J5GKX7_ZINOF|nr:hypothetical protein ZIOFF_034314 [Zingiber officinale]